MNNILLIAGREFITRVRTKTTIISLVVISVLLIAGGAIGGYFLNKNSDLETIAIRSDLQSIASTIEQLNMASPETFDLKVKIVDSDAQGLKLLRDKKVDYALHGQAADLYISARGSVPSRVLVAITQGAQNNVGFTYLQSSGIDPMSYLSKISNVKVSPINIEDASGTPPKPFLDNISGFIAASVIIFLMFAIILASGQILAMGIVEEKSSRIVEILLATVRPYQLLIGKILGISLLAFLQVTVMGIAAFIGLYLLGIGTLNINPAAISLWSLVWMVLGYSTSIMIFAGLGALASRVEDLNGSMAPVMFLQIIPLYLSYFLGMNNVQSPILHVVSFIPFFNYYAMPVRQVLDTVPVWEALLSVGINLAVLPLLVWLGATVYRRGIMQTGTKISLFKVFSRQA